MSAVPHISISSSSLPQAGVDLVEAPTEPVGEQQEPVGDQNEPGGELTEPPPVIQPHYWAGADLPSTRTPPNPSQFFLTSDAGPDLDQDPTAPQSTALQLYLSLDVPVSVPAPVLTPTELVPVSTSTERAPALS
jgi:hypothetical protein